MSRAVTSDNKHKSITKLSVFQEILLFVCCHFSHYYWYFLVFNYTLLNFLFDHIPRICAMAPSRIRNNYGCQLSCVIYLQNKMTKLYFFYKKIKRKSCSGMCSSLSCNEYFWTKKGNKTSSFKPMQSIYNFSKHIIFQYFFL